MTSSTWNVAAELGERERRRNYWLHVGEGAALIGGFGAINANTVGTSLVEVLGGGRHGWSH